MGVAAFIFEVTRPKLLQLAWFRWLYEHVMLWLAGPTRSSTRSSSASDMVRPIGSALLCRGARPPNRSRRRLPRIRRRADAQPAE